MWPFKKKVKAPEIELIVDTIKLSEGQMLILCELHDEFLKAPANQDWKERYLYWKFIREQVPADKYQDWFVTCKFDGMVPKIQASNKKIAQ